MSFYLTFPSLLNDEMELEKDVFEIFGSIVIIISLIRRHSWRIG